MGRINDVKSEMELTKWNNSTLYTVVKFKNEDRMQIFKKTKRLSEQDASLKAFSEQSWETSQ